MSTNTPPLSFISTYNKFRLVCKYFPENSAVLEVGSGSGKMASRLQQKGYRVTTLDLAPPADIIGDIRQWHQLGIQPRSFDAVIAFEVIEHVDCLEELQNICRPEGLIMLSTPHPNWDWLMQVLENLNLLQKRTSPHTNLINFNSLSLPAVCKQRPLFIHQVAIFKNTPQY